MKKSLNQLKDEAATLSIELHEFQAEQRKLEAQVVQSPERKKKEMIDASKSIQDERHSRDEAEAKVYHGKLCLKNVDQTEQYLNKCSALYEEAFVVQAKYDEICIETQKADESIEENKRKALEIDVLVSHSRRELQRNGKYLSIFKFINYNYHVYSNLINRGKNRPFAAASSCEEDDCKRSLRICTI